MKTVKRDFARLLRREQTPAEERVWGLLRNNQFMGLKFRRQHVVEGFVVDFYCFKHRLAIELDGGVHDSKNRRDYDELRQIELEAKGVAFIRVRNEEVLEHEQSFLDKIVAATNKSPSPSGRGGGTVKRQQGVRATTPAF